MYLARTRTLRDEARAFFERELPALGLELRTGPAPFLLARGGRDGTAIMRELLARKVYVRPGRDWDLPGWFRLSYGTMAQNRQVAAARKQVLQG